MIGIGEVIAFFVGAIVGRYFEVFIDLFRTARKDLIKVKENLT